MFRVCTFCGATFYTKRIDALYCSNRCKNAVWRDRKRREKKALDGQTTREISELITAYPKLGRPLRSMLKLYGAGAVVLALRCLNTVEKGDYHV